MTEPIRIAQIVGNICYGGVGSVVLNYYRNIDRTAYQFDFYSYCPSPFDEEIISLGGRVFYIDSFSSPIRATKTLYRMLKDKNYKIVHSHLNTLSYFSLRAAKKAGVPIRIAHNHSTAAKRELSTPVKAVLKRYATKNATALAACSQSSARWIYKDNASKATIFNNAIDTARFAFDPSLRNSTREELALGDSFVLLHVGRFAYQKNHKFLVDTFAKIHQHLPNSLLLLVGSGKLEQKIQHQVIKLKLEGCVRFLGARKDVQNIYCAADLLLLPSFYEGLPVVAVEAQCSGLPVIASDAVTKEAAIADISFLSFSDDWTNAVAAKQNTPRSDQSQLLKEKGFDIAVEATLLSKYYTDLINEQN